MKQIVGLVLLFLLVLPARIGHADIIEEASTSAAINAIASVVVNGSGGSAATAVLNGVTSSAVKGMVTAVFNHPRVQDYLYYHYQRTKNSVRDLTQEVLNVIQKINPNIEIGEDVKQEIVEQTQSMFSAKSIISGTEYDLIFDATSLRNISMGWTIIDNRHGKFIEEGQIAGVIGSFDVGKTYIIDLIDKTTLPSGITSVTPALGFYQSRQRNNVIFLDSQGSRRLVSSSREKAEISTIEDRIATDHFITNAVIEMSHFLLYIVGPLHTHEVIEINNIYKKRLYPSGVRPMCVVHNLLDYSEKEEVEKHIDDDILKAFPGAEKNSPFSYLPHCANWLSHGGKVEHVVLAKNGTHAGDYYNDCALELIKKSLDGLKQKDKIDAVKKVKEVAENMLSDYFVPPNSTPGIPPDTLWNQIIKLFATQFWHGQTDHGDGIQNIFPLEVVRLEQENKTVLRLKQTSETKVQPLIYLPTGDQGVPDAAFAPTYDIFIEESTKTWLFLMDVPGLIEQPECECLDDITLLTITGKRELPPYPTSHLKSWGNNRKYGRFRMTISLPRFMSCDSAKENPAYEKGVFRLFYSRTPNYQLPSPMVHKSSQNPPADNANENKSEL